jgi:hypothetical protein
MDIMIIREMDGFELRKIKGKHSWKSFYQLSTAKSNEEEMTDPGK